jgi:hypothetical protein
MGGELCSVYSTGAYRQIQCHCTLVQSTMAAEKKIERKLLILNLYYFIVSYAEILWFCKKKF